VSCLSLRLSVGTGEKGKERERDRWLESWHRGKLFYWTPRRRGEGQGFLSPSTPDCDAAMEKKRGGREEGKEDVADRWS